MVRKKYESKFPVARIKKLIQKDEQIGKLNALTPFAIAKALELYLDDVLADLIACSRLRRTLELEHESLQLNKTLTENKEKRDPEPDSTSPENEDAELGKSTANKRKPGGRHASNLNLSKKLKKHAMIKIDPIDLYCLSMMGYPDQAIEKRTSEDLHHLFSDIPAAYFEQQHHESWVQHRRGYYWILFNLVADTLKKSHANNVPGAMSDKHAHIQNHASASSSGGGDIYPLGHYRSNKTDSNVNSNSKNSSITDDTTSTKKTKTPRKSKKLSQNDSNSVSASEPPVSSIELPIPNLLIQFDQTVSVPSIIADEEDYDNL